jgi:threonine/homoserine/homoserine lactone efflux protein
MDALGIVHVGAFVVAGLLLNLTPGPDLLYASTQAGAHGARAGWIAALGIGAGGLVHVALGALGVSALLAASASAFAVLKLAGAAWLAWIGARMLLAPRFRPAASQGGTSGPGAPSTPGAVAAGHAPRPAAAILREAVPVAVLNPKVALFFLAFVPQFIDPASPRPALAFVLLGALFVVNGTLVTGAVGTMSAAAAASLRAGPADRGWRRVAAPFVALLPRAVGAALLGLGLRLAAAER